MAAVVADPYSAIAGAVDGIVNSVFGFLGIKTQAKTDQVIYGRSAIVDYGKNKNTNNTILIGVVAIAVVLMLVFSKKKS
jgi:hypothetical protein